jgi:Ni/Co efflux regulator RcnB
MGVAVLAATAVAVVAATALLGAPSSQAGFLIPFLHPRAPHKATHHKPPAHSKRRAERNVLRLVPRGWNAKARSLGLINRDTNLVKDNVQALCRGKGVRIGTRYRRFNCAVWSWPRRGRAGLYLTYQVRGQEWFRTHLVRVRTR